MASALDLLVLTFNCAKNVVDGKVFADHMHGAFRDNATGLPDLIALSLQEVAPLSYSFIGGYFLEPYLSAFEDAINEAAVRIETSSPDDDDSTVTKQGPRKPFTLVRSHNVGYTAVLLLARDPAAVRRVEQAEVGFGAAEMGNKGAVGLRVLYNAGGSEEKETELTFVATHLAAMEWNLPRRNANWAAIMRGLTFDDPEAVVERFRAEEEGTPVGDDGDEQQPGETTRLLHDAHHEQHLRLQRHLHDISVFRPSSHLFVAGDLNYRISTTAPPAENARFPSLDPDSGDYYPRFLSLDQLTRERRAGRTMHGLDEAEIKFPPTYKYDIEEGGKEGEEVKWSFAPHRWPSWTDRVLFLDIPRWVSEKKQGKSSSSKMDVLAYNAMPIIRSSDHRGVYLRIRVPFLSPTELAPPLELEGSDSAGVASSDPRVRLPVEVDPEAWGRRAAARKKEVMAGWSMFLWSTKQGAAVLVTVAVVGAGAWLWRKW